MVELSGGSVNQLGYVEAGYFHNPSENSAFKTNDLWITVRGNS
jgi:hypothetical protein